MVIVKLETWEQKLAVLKNKYKIRHHKKRIFIDNDLTKLERKVQQEIGKKATEEREKGNKIKIGYKKININDNWYK